MGADSVDDLRIPKDGQTGGMAAGTVSSVGDLCSLPQLGRVGAELKKCRDAHGATLHF